MSAIQNIFICSYRIETRCVTGSFVKFGETRLARMLYLNLESTVTILQCRYDYCASYDEILRRRTYTLRKFVLIFYV